MAAEASVDPRVARTRVAVVAAVAHIVIGLAVRKFRMGGSLALGPHIIGSAGLMLGLALV